MKRQLVQGLLFPDDRDQRFIYIPSISLHKPPVLQGLAVFTSFMSALLADVVGIIQGPAGLTDIVEFIQSSTFSADVMGVVHGPTHAADPDHMTYHLSLFLSDLRILYAHVGHFSSVNH